MPSILYDAFDAGLDVRRGATVSDANRLRVLTNAYVTTGKTIQKRPCWFKIATLETGTKGLRAGLGKLNTFYESGTITHANTLFQANKLNTNAADPQPNGGVSRIWFCEPFNGYLYVSAEFVNGTVKHFYRDGTNPPIVTDVNCPHGRAVTKTASKIFSAKDTSPRDTVRYSKTNAPKDWTTASDAGFISVGIQQAGAQECYALSQYQDQMVAFFADSAQIWFVDPNPANFALTKRVFGVGTRYAQSAAAFAEDCAFLCDSGVRSLTVNAQSGNLQDNDIGTPIDTLVVPSISGTPQALYIAALGQYWLVMGSTAWVYSFSRSAKISAWSKYTFPFTVDDITQLENVVYCRSGDNVYQLRTNTYKDDQTLVKVEVQLPYVNNKQPGYLKQFIGVDGVVVGNPTMYVKWDPNRSDVQSDPISIQGDSRGMPLTPVEVCSVAISPYLVHDADEDFRLDALQFYYEILGRV